MDPSMIDTKQLRTKLEELILDIAKEGLPGEAKLKKVVHRAADWLDERAKWGFLGPLGIAAEAADGPAFRKILWIPAQWAYDSLKLRGLV
jgi:hypothetical protein